MENSLPLIRSRNACEMRVLRANISQSHPSFLIYGASLEALFSVSQLIRFMKYRITSHRLGYNVITESIIITNTIITVSISSSGSCVSMPASLWQVDDEDVESCLNSRLDGWQFDLPQMLARATKSENEKWIICHIPWHSNNKQTHRASFRLITRLFLRRDDSGGNIYAKGTRCT